MIRILNVLALSPGRVCNPGSPEYERRVMAGVASCSIIGDEVTCRESKQWRVNCCSVINYIRLSAEPTIEPMRGLVGF